MKKIYVLYLFLILFIIPCLILFPNKNQENFAGKKSIIPFKTGNEEETYELTPNGNHYSFKIKDNEISIFPSNKKNRSTDIYFFYSSNPNKKLADDFYFYEIDSQNYKIDTPNYKFKMNLSISDYPLKFEVNNYDKTFEFEKAKTGNNQNTKIFNLLHFKQPCGNIKITKDKNKTSKMILKTTNKDIKNSPEFLSTIFTGFLIFDKISNLSQYEYDKFFSK